jgi:hypothetical protein
VLGELALATGEHDAALGERVQVRDAGSPKRVPKKAAALLPA